MDFGILNPDPYKSVVHLKFVVTKNQIVCFHFLYFERVTMLHILYKKLVLDAEDLVESKTLECIFF